MLEDQNGKCVICMKETSLVGRSQYGACVDHDHKTGRIRGILCGNCNTWIGYIENNNINLQKVSSYLFP